MSEIKNEPNSNFFDFQHYYLVGIKGVAMTAMAQLLKDANKKVSGSDVSDDFVTKEILDKIKVEVETEFANLLPSDVDCLIYTSAHQADQNPQVIQARKSKIPCLSHAEALAKFFNQKFGIAVCGVGGKSTISAMISWILHQHGANPSFSVGVGNIPNLNQTGSWKPNSKHFVAEADEYVTNPASPPFVPRFSFLNPNLIVSTHILHDHPDVYPNFSDTLRAFSSFFSKLSSDEIIIRPESNIFPDFSGLKAIQITYGSSQKADYRYEYLKELSINGESFAKIFHQDQSISIKLKIPGEYNMQNATAALATCHQLGFALPESARALESFLSTKRRFEFIGTKNQVSFYDDYAHHPHELRAVITALNEWFPDKKSLIAFQPHTYSRTKKLFTEFVAAFREANQVIILDIFASAREKEDSSISSQLLVDELKLTYPQKKVIHISTPSDLANYFRHQLKPNQVVLTAGAGDIYTAHNIYLNNE